MKAATLILTFLIYISSYGQVDKLRGVWITPEQDLILIDDTAETSNELVNRLLEDRINYLSIYNDTLSFQKRYYGSMEENAKLIVDKYDLKIISNSDTDLIVQPVSTLSEVFFQNRLLLVFRRQEFAIDTTIDFEKIIYHTTECFGPCPTIDLEIDNNRNIYINYETSNTLDYDPFESGQYIGILDDPMYQELVLLIKTCNLKTLRFDTTIIGADAPYRTFIIYFNGQRKYLSSMLPPTIMDRLIDYLDNIHIRTRLSKTKEKRKLEK